MKNFEGHELVIINKRGWVFDLTDFICYRVKTNSDNKVVNKTEAFRVNDLGEEVYQIEKKESAPLGVVRMVIEVVNDYKRKIGEFGNELSRTIRAEV